MGIGTGRDSGNVGGGGGDSRSGAEPSTAQENTMAAGIGDGRRDVGGEERGDRGGGERTESDRRLCGSVAHLYQQGSGGYQYNEFQLGYISHLRGEAHSEANLW